jgi:hypothetical protein
MKTTPRNLSLTQEIHALLVDIAVNDPDREKRIAAADAELEFWDSRSWTQWKPASWTGLR